MTGDLMEARQRIEAKIDELIEMLDLLDGDPDLEEENEHGGDILDVPHDDLDQGDSEPNLGWPEKEGQGKRIGIDCGPGDFTYDPCDTDGIGPTGRTVNLSFDGDGYHIGRKLLRVELNTN